jgi:ABC-2 type transport system permease protein
MSPSPSLVIAWTDLRRVARDRHNVFWIFVAPLIFVSFFGMMLQPGPPTVTKVSIVNEDPAGQVAARLASMVSGDRVSASVVAKSPQRGFFVVVPAGTAQALAAGTPVTLVLHAGPEATDAERRVQFRVQKALMELTLGDTPADAGAEPVLRLVEASLDTRPVAMTIGFQRAVPSYLVMFVFLNLLVSGARLAEERTTGKFRRLVLAPIGFTQIVLGKLLALFIVGWVQMAYLLVVGVVVFRISWGGNAPLLFAFLSVFALSVAALGVLLSTVFDDPDKCATLGVWATIIMAPLGGLWWPLEIVGPTLRKLAYVVPTGWAMEGVNSLLAFGASALDLAPFAGAMAGLFAVSLVLATRRLRRQLVA